jgi:hypothetical protein
MSNIIDSIQLSGVTYTIQGSGGNPTVELTQAEYDALVTAGTVSPTTYYIITDAQAGDLTQYWTSAQTNSAITQATSGLVETSAITSAVTSASTDSEIPTAKAVYDAIPQGGEGKSVEAGRGISVASGTSAYTVSFNLPISAGTGSNSIAEGNNTAAIGDISHAEGYNTSVDGNYSHAEGYNTSVNGNYSHAEGYYSLVNGNYSHAEGNGTIAYNDSEHASGQHNVSSKASTTFGDSGNTLFSVGNGTAYNARHNAFEIRQNGDIYLSLNGQDVKLQDTITATAANTTALGGLSLVKLTQSEYDALATKDNSTLYVIVN